MANYFDFNSLRRSMDLFADHLDNALRPVFLEIRASSMRLHALLELHRAGIRLVSVERRPRD